MFSDIRVCARALWKHLVSHLYPTPRAAHRMIVILSSLFCPSSPLSLSVVLPRALSGSQEATADLSGLGINKGTLEKQEQAAGGEWSPRPSELPDVVLPFLLPSLLGHHIHQAL